jgi:DNA topoisomerase-1
LKEFGEDPQAKTNVVAKSGQFGLYVTDGAINATVPKDEPLEELTPERAFELLAIRREKLGLEPGQPAPKASKSRKSVAPARTVKKGSTRKAK